MLTRLSLFLMLVLLSGCQPIAPHENKCDWVGQFYTAVVAEWGQAN